MEHEGRLKAALADRYAIEREIGSGGMATVYLAQDLKHDRRVAVKVLKPELAAVMGTERFLAEIRTTANLQHPHILPLFDSGEVDGFLFYVMPYVEAESLRERLNRAGQLPVDEAVRIAGHIADALDYAHRHDVIHRDIKPANILFEEDQPLVSDFGIALAVSAAGEGRLTETGLSLGTPYYMSPEQAAGEETTTASSDVYSLGCVLYEMLTGDPPHTGSSAQAILGKILLGEVTRPTKLRRAIPANVEGAVLKALERLPADRFESASGFSEALKDKGFRHGVSLGAQRGGQTLPWKAATAALGILLVITAAALLLRDAGDSPGLVARFAVSFPPGQELLNVPGVSLSLTADGSRLVYVGPSEGRLGRQLWVRHVDELHARPIPGTDGAENPVPSPDGEQVAFRFGDSIQVVSANGGTPVTLVEGTGIGLGLDWGGDGFIYYTAPDSVVTRIPAVGGESESVSDLSRTPGATRHLWMEVLPNGGGVVFSAWTGTRAETSVWLLNLATGEYTHLARGMMGRYLAPGFILFAEEDGTLLAAPFDLDNLQLTGPSVPLSEMVWVRGGAASQFTVSQTGTLAYIPGTGSSRVLVWVDRQGTAQEIDPRLAGNIRSPALSPDGNRIAFSSTEGTQRTLWSYEIPQNALSLIVHEGVNDLPFWSSDSRRIGFVTHQGDSSNLFSVRYDGSGVPEPILDAEGVVQGTWLPDDQGVVVSVQNSTQDIQYSLPGGETGLVDFLASPAEEGRVAISHDGRWLAYTSDASGTPEVYVQPFPGPGDRILVSIGTGGTEPVWAHGGSELFYKNGLGELVAARVSTDQGFAIVDQEVLFSALDFVGLDFQGAESAHGPQYSVAPDNQTFLMAQWSGLFSGPIVVMNFGEELRARLGGDR